MSKESARPNLFGSRYRAKLWADHHGIKDYVICRSNEHVIPLYRIYVNIEPGEIDRIAKIIKEGDDHD